MNGSSTVWTAAASSGEFSLASGEFAKAQPHVPRTAQLKSSTQGTTLLDDLNRLPLEKVGLWGRQHELQSLQSALERLWEPNKQETRPAETAPKSASSQIGILLVQGPSGSGKSAVLQTFTQNLSKQGMLVGTGTFERHLTAPYAALARALAQISHQILGRPDFTSNLQPKLQQVVLQDGDYHILVELVPNLAQLLWQNGEDNSTMSQYEQDEQENSEDTPSTERRRSFHITKSEKRFRHLVKCFVRALCAEHPMVLCLDGVEWMDAATWDVCELLLRDKTLSKRFALLCAHRLGDEETLFQQKMSSIGQPVETVGIYNFNLATTHSYLTELLNSHASMTESLAQVVHEKVDGNPFFLRQFLLALTDGGYLSYNLGPMAWIWDEYAIRTSAAVTDNVLNVLMDKVGLLNGNTQRILCIASKLGLAFDKDVLELVASSLPELGEDSLWMSCSQEKTAQSTERCLQDAVDHSLVEILPDRGVGDHSSLRYRFAHTQIVEAVQSLLPERTRRELAFRVGRVLYEQRQKYDYVSLQFVAVDLLNQSRSLISEPSDVDLLVDLNLQAGKKALASSAFALAADHLRKARDNVPQTRRQWNDENYEQLLDLHNALVSADFCSGSWERLKEDIQSILSQKNRPVFDKIVAYTTSIAALSTHDHNHDGAIALSVHVLEQLGVKFRPSLGKLGVVGALIKTKQLLKKRPLDSVLEQPDMTDKSKLVALDLIMAMNSSLYAANPELLMVTVLKTVRWSLKFGVSRHSSNCIGIYGLLELALGNIEGATAACNIALKLAQKQGLMDTEFAPIAPTYGFALPWTTPLHSCQKELLKAYNVGLQCGDLEHAFMNIVLYCFFCYCTGKPLSDLEADMRDYGRQMTEYNQKLQYQFLCLTWQTILNLMGRCEDPAVLSGEVMSQEGMLQEADADNNPPLRSQVQCHRLQLAVYFGDYELASYLIGQASNIGTVNPGNVIVWRNALFEGIAAFELSRRGQRRFRGIAKRALSRVQKWVNAGNVNCVHILHFLKAEQAASMSNVTEARSWYDKAIATAARFGFRNDQALANERCGELLSRNTDNADNMFWAADYLQKAFEAYTDLGAHGKTDHMIKQHAVLRPSMDISLLGKTQGKKSPLDGLDCRTIATDLTSKSYSKPGSVLNQGCQSVSFDSTEL